MRNSLVLLGVALLWHVAQWVSRAPPHHTIAAFLNLNGTYVEMNEIFGQISLDYFLPLFNYLIWHLIRYFPMYLKIETNIKNLKNAFCWSWPTSEVWKKSLKNFVLYSCQTGGFLHAKNKYISKNSKRFLKVFENKNNCLSHWKKTVRKFFNSNGLIQNRIIFYITSVCVFKSVLKLIEKFLVRHFFSKMNFVYQTYTPKNLVVITKICYFAHFSLDWHH